MAIITMIYSCNECNMYRGICHIDVQGNDMGKTYFYNVDTQLHV